MQFSSVWTAFRRRAQKTIKTEERPSLFECSFAFIAFHFALLLIYETIRLEWTSLFLSKPDRDRPARAPFGGSTNVLGEVRSQWKLFETACFPHLSRSSSSGFRHRLSAFSSSQWSRSHGARKCYASRGRRSVRFNWFCPSEVFGGKC